MNGLDVRVTLTLTSVKLSRLDGMHALGVSNSEPSFCAICQAAGSSMRTQGVSMPDDIIFVAQVEAYLEAFAAAFDLEKHIRFNTSVLRVSHCERGGHPGARFGADSARQNGHLDNGNASRSAPGAAMEGHSMSNLPNGGEVAGENGTIDSEELPWPRWQVTTVPNEEQVRHSRVCTYPDNSICRQLSMPPLGSPSRRMAYVPGGGGSKLSACRSAFSDFSGLNRYLPQAR